MNPENYQPTPLQIELAGKLLNAIKTQQTRKETPQLWHAIHGRRFLLPHYRQTDYESQDRLNEDFEFSLLATAMGLVGFNDDVHHAMYSNFCGALWYDRPMLFLERELAEPLGESSLPEEMLVADIEWKWPQFRLMLPKNYLTINRDGADRSVLFLDICKVDQEGLTMPPKYADESDSLTYRILDEAGFTGGRPKRAAELRVTMNQPYVAVVGGLNWSEVGAGQGTSYASIVPWNDKKIGELLRIQGPGLQSHLKCDEVDNELIGRMLRLAFNVLLFLSQKPMVYKPEVVRAAKSEGKHRTRPELAKAHFLGQEQFRTAAAMLHGAQKAAEAAGKVFKLKAHWRKGHWKRQPYGPKNTLRRWQWISIYRTFGPDETSE